jgi:uncharacterized protein (TIGR02466 family)
MFGTWTVLNTEKIHNLFSVPLYWWRPDPVVRHGVLQEFAAQRKNIDANLDTYPQDEYTAPRCTDEYKQSNSAHTYHLHRAQNLIDQCVREYTQLLGYRTEFEPDHIWFNRVDPGASHIWHSHGGCTVSGTLWLQIPSGDIEFRTPNPYTRAGYWPTRDDCSPTISRTPSDGDIGVWPSWLEHRVTPNTSREPRYAMSFDYVPRRG